MIRNVLTYLLILVVVKSLRNTHFIRSTIISSLHLKQEKLESIITVCCECITISKERFSDGHGFVDRGKDHMGTWMPHDQLSKVLREVNNTAINASNDLVRSITNSVLPICVPLYSSSEFELKVLYLPKKSSMPPRVHSAGTLLVYNSMMGQSLMKSTLSNGREIGVDTFDGSVISRLGGPTRVFYSGPQSPTIILELAIYPPRIEFQQIDDQFATRSDEVVVMRPPEDCKRSFLLEKQLSPLEAFRQDLYTCIDYSLSMERSNEEIYTSSSSSSNNPFAVGAWLDDNLLDAVVRRMKDFSIDPKCNLFTMLQKSETTAVIELFSDEACELSLLYTPANQTMPPRQHFAGTVLIFQSLPGSSSSIRTLVASRQLSVDYLEGLPIKRLGGPERVIKTDSLSKPAFILELAIFPPKDSAFGDMTNSSPASRFSERSGEVNFITASFDEKVALLGDIRDLNRWGKEGYKESISSSTKEKFDDQLSISIGGLAKEIEEIRRRILLSRQLDKKTLSDLGISHIKGVLLYGPPGTGKTLMAREIAKVLNAREPKIINGPEILDKYVGEAERNIRLIFKDAEEEWSAVGLNSALHVIIFDEFDAIAKSRGSLGGDDSGVRDSVVNQLLSKMDGVGELQNILVIGLTNRKDLVDEALLRPGRFEVHLEIKVPSINGRQEILAILVRKMVQGGILDENVALDVIMNLSEKSQGWSGADLAGLVRSSVAFSLARCLDKPSSDLSVSEDSGNRPLITLTENDFYLGYEEILKSKQSIKSKFMKKFREIPMLLPRISFLKKSSWVSQRFMQTDKKETGGIEVLLSGGPENNKEFIKFILSRTK